MKFSLKWLEEELETDAGPREIANELTMIGLELESLDDPADKLKDFVVGYVEDAKPHPDADRLQVCRVNNGTETFEVVCGAPNARTGMKGVFAPEGSYIPGIDTVLKKSKIRGVTSNGMLLSEREIGLSDEHEGIIELGGDAVPGAPAVEALGMSDPVFDIGITPNRGDCLGVRGIARDLAAAGIGTLKPLLIEPVDGKFKSPIKVHLDFDDETISACPYFVGRYFRGVENGPSPDWLQQKLLAIGLRPISALVDITNLLTMAYGRPLHVFDADKVHGDIHVRLSRKGEKILALDGKEYELDDEMTVIADEKEPEALGGVMGGEISGCTGETVNVFLESAYFDPIRTAATGRKLNLTSDARYRFERGIDPDFVLDGAELASRLLLDLCGGEASDIVIAGEKPDVSRSYPLRKHRVKELGGVEISEEETVRILNVLGFNVTDNGDAWECDVPSWRHDVVGEADLVEEVARIHGFDNIPAVPLVRETSLPSPAVSLPQARRARARRALAGRGLTESVTFSFLPRKHADLFGGVPEAVNLVNPISADLDVMRPSLLPNLIDAARRNADKGFGDVSLYEVGPQFAGENPEDQATVASGVRAGLTGPRDWAGSSREVDAFDAKADVMAVFEQLGVSAGSARISSDAPAWYHPGRSGTIAFGPQQVLAHFGEIHPGILQAMDAGGPMAGFEIYLENLPRPKDGKSAMRPPLTLSAFQPVERDFAFIVDDGVAADDLAKAAAAADKKLISGVRVFDEFQGGDLEAGKKSLAIAVTLQPTQATLTDEEIEAVSGKVVANVAKHTKGVLRG